MTSSRRHVAPVAVAMAVGIVAAGGCNLVVGSADYKVATLGDGGMITGPGDAATDDVSTVLPDGGTPPGPDGATPGPDTGAPPVDSGTPPTDGGTTTVCGPNGTLNPGGLPTNDPAFQQLVKSCVLAVSCDPVFFDVTASQCITNDYLHASLPTDCLSKITSCADYYACRGSRIPTVAECSAAVTAAMDIGTCNNGVATSCHNDGQGFVWNCAAVGGTCVVYNEDSVNTAAGCQVLSGCTDSTSGLSVHCASATQVYTCESTSTSTNLGIGTQICPQGTSCQTVNGISGCYQTTSPCTSPGASCAGGNLTTCQNQGTANEQYTTNCAAAGLQCNAGLGTAACTASGCAAANCTESCNGNQLQVCIGGAPFLVDCPSLGLATCNFGTNSASNDFYFCSNQ